MTKPRHGSFRVRALCRSRRSGFSLIEVALAVGLIGFCLVALLGLLQVGLQQERASIDQTQATHVLDAVKDSLRGRLRLPEGEAPVEDRFGLQIPASPGAAPVTQIFVVNESGEPVSVDEPNAYVVRCEVRASNGAEGVFKPWHARITVAWPGAAEFQGSGPDLRLRKAQGHIDTTLEVNRG
jgi:Tfp pilus assembly protein PilV